MRGLLTSGCKGIVIECNITKVIRNWCFITYSIFHLPYCILVSHTVGGTIYIHLPRTILSFHHGIFALGLKVRGRGKQWVIDRDTLPTFHTSGKKIGKSFWLGFLRVRAGELLILLLQLQCNVLILFFVSMLQM